MSDADMAELIDLSDFDACFSWDPPGTRVLTYYLLRTVFVPVCMRPCCPSVDVSGKDDIRVASIAQLRVRVQYMRALHWAVDGGNAGALRDAIAGLTTALGAAGYLVDEGTEMLSHPPFPVFWDVLR